MIYCDTKLRYWQGNMNYWPGENLYDTWNRTEVYFGILVHFRFFRMSNSTGFPTGRGSHSLKLESVLYLSLLRIFKIEITRRKAIFHRHRSYMLLLHIFQDRCMYQAHTFGIFGGLVGSLVVGLSYRIYSPVFDDKFHLLCNISLSNFQTCHLNIAFQVDSSNMDLFCNGNMVSLIHNFHLLCNMYPLVHTCFLFGIAFLVNTSTLVHKLKFLNNQKWDM